MSHFLELAQNIYGNLQDEESKEIFKMRMLFESTGEWHFIRELVGKYLRGYDSKEIFIGIKNEIDNMKLNKEGNYIIYGAGTYGKQVYEYLMQKGINVVAFSDQDEAKQQQKYCNKEVIAPEEILKQQYDKVILAVWGHSEAIIRALCSIGIKETQILDCFKLRNYVDENQYFDTDIVKFNEDEVFVDCGCFDLDTTKKFLTRCPNKAKVYAFEPDLMNYKCCKEEINKLDINNVEVFPYGVWCCKDKLRFNVNNGSASAVSEEGTEEIDVVAIDSIVKDDKVTFIKMDVEGSELEALRGAKETIIRNKPRLAISVYHNIGDMITIGNWILNTVPEYKLYLRHYSNFYATETVMYAIV